MLPRRLIVAQQTNPKGMGGGQISAAYRRRTGGPGSSAKSSLFSEEKPHCFGLSFSAFDPDGLFFVLQPMLEPRQGAKRSGHSAGRAAVLFGLPLGTPSIGMSSARNASMRVCAMTPMGRWRRKAQL